jgi:hypothetical protein
MAEPITLADLTDHERRWMVHILATLQENIDDELQCAFTPFYDAHMRAENPERFRQIWQYMHEAMTQVMERIHPEEAAAWAAEAAAFKAEHGSTF